VSAAQPQPAVQKQSDLDEKIEKTAKKLKVTSVILMLVGALGLVGTMVRSYKAKDIAYWMTHQD